jgi:hypothetical protein
MTGSGMQDSTPVPGAARFLPLTAGKLPEIRCEMAVDTLAYAKELEAAGVERQAAEAHAEARTKHVLPDFATKGGS